MAKRCAIRAIVLHQDADPEHRSLEAEYRRGQRATNALKASIRTVWFIGASSLPAYADQLTCLIRAVNWVSNWKPTVHRTSSSRQQVMAWSSSRTDEPVQPGIGSASELAPSEARDGSRVHTRASRVRVLNADEGVEERRCTSSWRVKSVCILRSRKSGIRTADHLNWTWRWAKLAKRSKKVQESTQSFVPSLLQQKQVGVPKCQLRENDVERQFTQAWTGFT